MRHFRCCWCGREVDDVGDDVLSVDIAESRGPRLRLRWHSDPDCFDADPLCHELVAALTTHDETEAGGAKVALAYDNIRRRVLLDHGDARWFVDVRRDYDHSRLTLRGSGEAWGVRSSRW